MTKTFSQNLIDQYGHDPLTLLSSVNGFYEVKKNGKGKRITPLVGYAAKYLDDTGKEKQYVGEVYANFAKAEEHPYIMFYLTKLLWEKLNIQNPVVFVGPAMGGISVAQFLALHASQKVMARYACAEKSITQLKTKTLREQSILQFARHTVNPGEVLVITEDVLNNFSTTKQLIELAKANDCKVGAIVGLLNRSMDIDSSYIYNNQHIPVVSLVRKPYPEYKQDDDYVRGDIENENVVLKPKNNWEKLKSAI